MSKIQVVNGTSPYNKTDAILEVINDYKDEIAYSFGDILELDQEYTFSCWFKADKNIQITINISEQQKKFDITTEWKRFTYTAPANTAKSKVVFFSIPPYSTLSAFEGQLEIGNKASDFKPSTEDVEHSINTLQTDFKVEQGRIEALIKDTTIDGVKLKDKFIEMVATVDGIKTTIGDTQFVEGESIASKLTKFEATADGLKTEVSKTNTKIDNMQIGGRNLICGTKDFTKDCFIANHGAVIIDNNVSYMGLKTVRVDRPWANIRFNLQEVLKRNNMKIGDTCVIQMMFMANFDDLGEYNFFLARACKGDTFPSCCLPAVKNLWHKASFSFVVDDYSLNDPMSKDCSIENNNWDKNIFNTTKRYIFGEGKFMWFSGLKLEKGNKATDWSPAPEDVDANITNVKTIAQQTADKFNWIVSSGSSSTNFQLTDRTADLVAEKINLKGLVTFSGLDKASQDKINKPNETLDSWTSQAVSGNTYINGGYIMTETIKSEQLNVTDIFSTGTAVMNIINAQEINADRITSGEISANRLNLHGLKITHQVTGKETFSIDQDGGVLLRGNVESYNYVSGKAGWSIRQDGNAEFNDVTVRGDLVGKDGGFVNDFIGKNLLKFTDDIITVESQSAYPNNGGWKFVTNDPEQKYHYMGAAIGNVFMSNWRHSAPMTAETYIYKEDLTPSIYSLQDTQKSSLGLMGEVDDEYTFSFTYNVKGKDTYGFTKMQLYFIDENSGEVSAMSESFGVTNPDGAWMKYSRTIKAPVRHKGFRLKFSFSTDEFQINSLKLERGNTETSWYPDNNPPKDVRFWAGESYKYRDDAPWIVYSDGSMKATKGEFSGVISGEVNIGNILIKDPDKSTGDDALLTITHGSTGVKKVQLRDTNESSFAQNIHIQDDFYNNQISLYQNGSAYFSNLVSVGNNTHLTNGALVINENRLTADTDGYTFDSPYVGIGSAKTNSHLKVFGLASVDGDLNVRDKLIFDNKVVFTKVENGLNIDII